MTGKTSFRLLAACLFLLYPLLGAASKADGTWDCVFNTEVGERRGQLVIQVSGEQVSGKLVGPEPGRSVDIRGTFKAGELYLKFPFYSVDAGYQADLIIRGSIDGDRVEGTWQFDTYTGSFTGTRAK